MIKPVPLARIRCVLLLAVSLAGPLGAGSFSPEPMSDPKARAFVTSLLPLGDHGVLAFYGGDGEHDVVQLQRLDSTLSVYGRPVVLTDLQRDAFEPRLASIGSGILVAWYDKDPQSGIFGAQLARFDWSGHMKWHRTLSQAGHVGRSPVARTSTDGAWVAWLESGNDAGAAVWVEHVSEDGAPLAPPQQAGKADAETSNLNAAVDTAGSFYVVFDARLQNRARELQLVVADAGHVEQRALSADDGTASVFPDIAIQGAQVALCWVDASETRRAVRLAAGNLADLGAAFTSAPAAVTTGKQVVGGSYLAWNHGRVGVAWNVTGPDAGVFVRHFDGRGRARGDAVRVAQSVAPALPSVPVVAAWQRGFSIAWNEYTADVEQHRVSRSNAFRANLD